MQPPAGRVAPTPGRAAAPESANAANAANIFFNSDGDSAEISRRAMELLDRQLAGNESPFMQPETNRNIFGAGFRINSPSPFVEWPELPYDPTNALDFRNWVPTGNTPPIITHPSTIPTSAFPNMPTTGGAPQGGMPPAGGFTGISFVATGADPLEPQGNCETCSSRRYVDKSDDPSVSFQTPTKVSPNMAAAAVAAHEQEHVRSEQAKAERDGRDIVNQTVTLQYDCCPECGRNYVSGGTTRTTSIDRSEPDSMGVQDESEAGDEAA
jgi:hypothetical protein